MSPGEAFRVRVSWAGEDGTTETVDLAPALFKYKAYAPLRNDPGLFGSVRVTGDGFALAWGEGGLDMASATVEALAGRPLAAADVARLPDRDGAPVPQSTTRALANLEAEERDEDQRLLATQKAILRDLAERFAADDPADSVVDYLTGRAAKP